MLKEGLPEIRDLGFDVDFAAGAKEAAFAMRE